MSATIFLTQESLWPTLKNLARNCKLRKMVAVPYIGKNGSTPLRLREGDVLICALTEANARKGLVCPDEIEKLQRKGVKVWQKLDASDQAKVLLRLARYELDLDADADDIRQLIAEAKALDPGLDDTIVRVMLRGREEGVEAGLLELEEPKTITAFNLRLSLLFQASRYDDVFATLQNLPAGVAPDTEFDRFHALALLTKGDLPGARSKIAQALSEHGDWEFIQAAAAMIDYWSGMAAGLTTPKVIAAPAPTGPALARSDPESLQHFREAEQRFAALIESTQRGDEQKRCFEVWRLASLANDLTRQQEAADYSRELLGRDPAHHRVLLWAMAYKYPFDAPSSEEALEAILNEAAAADGGLVVEIALTPLPVGVLRTQF